MVRGFGEGRREQESTEGPEEEVATCDEVVDPNTNFSMPKETDQKKDRSKNAKLKQCWPLERFQNGLKRSGEKQAAQDRKD